MKRRLLGLAYLGQFVLGICDNIRGPILPDLIREFNLTQTRGSLFFALASITSFGIGFLTQFALHHWGVRRSLQISLLSLAIGQFGVAFSNSFTVVMGCCFFIGLGLGGIGVVVNVLVLSACQNKDTQKWQSLLHSIYGLSSLLAPLLVSLVFWFGSEWKATFLFSGSLAILGLIACWKDFSVEPHIGELHDSKPPSKAEELYFALTLSVYVLVEILVSSRLPSFMRIERSSTVEQANNLTSLFFIFLFLGRLLFMFWQPKGKLRRQMEASLLLTAVFIAIGILVHPLALALSGLAMAPFYPLAMTSLGKLFPRNVGSATSYCIALSGMTIVSMHLLVGYLSDLFSLKAAFWLGPIGAVLALAMIAVYRPLFHRQLP